jgi:hypothetical protein
MPKFSTLKSLLWKIWKMNDEITMESILVLVKSYIDNHPEISKEWNDIHEFLIQGLSGVMTNSLGASTLMVKRIRLQTSECLYSISKKMEVKDVESKYYDQWIKLCIQGMEDMDVDVRKLSSISYGEIISNITPKKGETVLDKKKTFNFTTSLFSLTSIFLKANTNTFRESITLSVIHFLKNFSQATIEENLDILISHLFSLLSNPKV